MRLGIDSPNSIVVIFVSESTRTSTIEKFNAMKVS